MAALVGVAAYVLFLVGAIARSGLSGLVGFLGLSVLAIGVIAGIRGRLGWARIATRRTGWLLAAAGLAVTAAGGAIAPPDAQPATSTHAVSKPAPLRTSVTPSPAASTTAPTPLPSATSAPVRPTPRATATHSAAASRSTAPTAKPSPKPSRTTPKPKPSRTTPPAPVRHACTRTSSGTCIQGGEFCKQALYGTSGWDANGRRYVCEGDHTHPHWMTP